MKTQTNIDTTGNPNTIIIDRAAADKAYYLAKGSYQRGILSGYYCMSGADLLGKARKYGAKYSRSRGALLGRLTENKIPHREVVGQHNKRILVIG